jgi:hypothetical protein
MAPRTRTGGVSLAVVVTIVAIAFLGIAYTSNFRRSVTRQMQTLLHNMQIVDIAEAALTEVTQDQKLAVALNTPANIAKLKAAFTGGTMRGGVLFPADTDLVLAPDEVRRRLAADPRIRVGDVQVVPLQYRPNKERQRGMMRFVVGVTLTENQRVFAKRIAHDYEYSVSAGDDPGTLAFLFSKAPKAKIYP